MINFKGISHNIADRKIYRVTRSFDFANLFCFDTIRIYPDNLPKYTFSAFLTTNSFLPKGKGIYNLSLCDLDKLHENDIVAVSSTGEVFLLWENESDNNLLFLTDFCNSKCIMCPQTNSIAPKNYYDDALTILNLIKRKPSNICLSGGEPTFLHEKYLETVSTIKRKYPSVCLEVLTNGKNFSDFNFTKKCILSSPQKTIYAIPIYSANSQLHDYIVGSKNSFSNTIRGIYNLYKFKQDIEIRIVITKNNFHDLLNIAYFIYWNLPFVHHIAFMGMETHGYARENLDHVWVEPAEYTQQLEKAVSFLSSRLMNVSLYNLPHCLLSPNIYQYARDSISEWKKSYLPECTGCRFINKCAGIFTTSCNTPKGIHAIK